MLTESDKESSTEIIGTDSSPTKEESLVDSIKELKKLSDMSRRKSIIVKAQSLESSSLAMNL